MILPNQELLAFEIHLAKQEQAAKMALVKATRGQLPAQPGILTKGLHRLGYQLESLGLKLQQKQQPRLTKVTVD